MIEVGALRDPQGALPSLPVNFASSAVYKIGLFLVTCVRRMQERGDVVRWVNERGRVGLFGCVVEIDCTNHAGVTIQSPQVDINTVVAGVGTRFLFHNGGRGAEASLISPTGTRSVSLSYYYTLCTFGIPDKDPPAMTNATSFRAVLCQTTFPPLAGVWRKKSTQVWKAREIIR